MSDLVVRTEADDYKPVMSIDDMIAQRNELRKYVNACLDESKPGTADGDYGTIPGAGNRKVLLLPGAQKLCRMRGLSPDYDILSEDEDWTGERHGGEPFFNYKIKCILYREDRRMGSGVGACNSFEDKYRYVKGERTCPVCGAGAIIAGKKEYGGGFVCFDKKGGCKAKFADNDTRITSQPVGKVEHPNPADLQNTILKMAKKRAYIDATLSVVGASEFFTQDVDVEKPAAPQVPKSQPGQRHNEQVYEADYVPERAYDDRYGPVKRKGDQMHNYAPNRPPSNEEAADADLPSRPVISKRQASDKLKAALDELGYAPANGKEFERIVRYLDNDKSPELWTAQDFLTAAALPEEILKDAIKAMYVPDAVQQPYHHTKDAAAKYQSQEAERDI